MGRDKLDELIKEALEEGTEGMKELSTWYGNLEPPDRDPCPLVEHPSGKYVCPGHPKICLYAGWLEGFPRLCDSCEHLPTCFPVSAAEGADLAGFTATCPFCGRVLPQDELTKQPIMPDVCPECGRDLLNVDVTGAILCPGDPEHCQGNGKDHRFEICCDGCNYFLQCYPEWGRKGGSDA